MDKERVLAYGHEQLELKERQAAAKPQVEVPATFEDVRTRYADLSERINALPSANDSPRWGNDGWYLDRHVYAQIDTDDEKIPELQLHLQTGHHTNENGKYDPRQSSYLVADWQGSDAGQREHLNEPTEHTDVTEAARILGLIEESVVEAEHALLALPV